MSQGRFHFEPQRAPAEWLSDGVDRPCVIGRIGVCRTAADWHALGVRSEESGDFESAIESYGRALLVGGPDTQVAFDLAYALAAAGYVDRAIERYRQVLELDPRRLDAWVNLGDLLLTAGQAKAAISALRQALLLDPDDAEAHYGLADALDSDGDTRRAASHWQRFLALSDGPAEQHCYAKARVAATANGK